MQKDGNGVIQNSIKDDKLKANNLYDILGSQKVMHQGNEASQFIPEDNKVKKLMPCSLWKTREMEKKYLSAHTRAATEASKRRLI